MPVPRRPVVAGELGSASPTPHSRQRRSSTQVMMDCCQAMPASEEHEQYGGNAMDLSHNAEPHRVRRGKVRDRDKAQEQGRNPGGRGRSREIAEHRGGKQECIEQSMNGACRPLLPRREIGVPRRASSPRSKHEPQQGQREYTDAGTLVQLVQPELQQQSS